MEGNETNRDLMMENRNNALSRIERLKDLQSRLNNFAMGEPANSPARDELLSAYDHINEALDILEDEV